MRFLTRMVQLVVLVALTLAATLWFAGQRGDRGMIAEEITIARPASAVFRWISSEDLARRWISGLVELRRADGGIAQQEAPGFKMTQIVAGHRVEMTLRIARVVPGQELSLTVSSRDPAAGFSGDANFRLIAAENYTRLLFTSHTQFVSWGDRILEPVLTLAEQRKIHDDLSTLKLLMESEPDRPANPRSLTLGR